MLNEQVKEALLITQEECAEVIQAISKVWRFGLNQTHNETGITNKEQLETELGQLYCMLNLLANKWKLDHNHIMNAATEKQKTIDKWNSYFQNGDV